MTNSKGFSLVEAMLAAGVLSLIVTTLAGALVFGEQSSVGAGKRSRATELAEEGIEAVRSIRDQAFNELQYAQSGVTISSNTWAFLGEATSETIDEFTRTTNFADVCRNVSKVIVACPGTYIDPHTKQVTVTVSWSGGTAATGSVSRTSYLTDWEASVWTQTDWAGGSGQATWSVTNRYDSDDGNVTISPSGEVSLDPAGAAAPWWDTAYGHRKKVTLGTAHSALLVGHTLAISMDTQPSTTNVELTSGNDVRVVWQPTVGAAVELNRIGSVWNSATTSIDFRLQSAISANLNEDADGSYYVYYGNAAAGTPPTNEMNVYYFADFFNRANSSTIGNGWTEWNGGSSNSQISSNSLTVRGHTSNYNGIKQTFPLGAITGDFVLEYNWTMPSNADTIWKHYVNVGNSATMSNTNQTTGVGPGIYNGEGSDFSPNGTENISNDLSGNMENSVNGGPHSIKLVVDATAKDYDYYRNGTLIASNQNWVSAGGTQDQIRIAARQYHQGQPVFTYDDLKLTLSVSDATENALGDEQVRTFIDDTQAEFDAGTYTATQYDAPNTWVELTATGQTSGTGTYASKIFDGGASATWDTLQWLPQRPSLKELPNNTGANDWWDNAYPFRKKITFGTSHSALSLGHTVSFTMDTQPATTSVELTSGNDVRIIWLPTAGLPVELDRIGSVWNSATTSIDFRLQSAISANLNEDTDGSYYVYYGNAAAGTPPSNEMNVYYFADFFNRANSSTIGNGWTEWTTGGGNVSIASNATSVVGNNQGPADAGIKQTFPLGALPGNFTLNFDWTMPVNTEGEWTHYLNIGNSSSMSNASRTTGVGPGIYNGEGGHFSPNGVENVSNDLTGNMENSVNGGPHAIRIVVNTSAQTYSYYRNAALVASGQTYVSAQSTLNQVRIATDVYSAGQPAFVYDNLKLTLDVADAPETTTGSEATEPTQSESGYGAGNMTLTSNIGLWHLNESSGTIADSSGNGNTGTLSGASYGASGRFNTALDFDGVDDFVSVPDSQTLDITGKLTLSAWVYADTTPELFDSPIIKTTDNDAWLDGYGMYFEGGLIKFWVDRYDTNVATASFSTGVWHHVVGTYDGANVRIYVDGVAGSVDPYAGAVTTNNTAMFIGAGADASGAGYFWDGKVDEVALFRRSLSATEVSDLYKRGAVRFKYLVRSCNDAACSGESFIGPDGTASTFYSELTNTTLTPPAAIALTNVTANRYFQYQTTLETSSSTLSPELKTVTVTLTPSGSSGYVTAGSFQSSAFNMTDNSPVEILEWDQSIPSCTPTCTIKLQVRTAPDASGSPGTWTAWYGATGSGTYFTTNTGTRIPLFLNGNRWVQYRVELAGDGVNTPTLQETRLFYR